MTTIRNNQTLDEVADVFGDHMTADGVGPHFTCTEADAIARLLLHIGRRDSAAVFLTGHASGDEDGDKHIGLGQSDEGADENAPEVQAYINGLREPVVPQQVTLPDSLVNAIEAMTGAARDEKISPSDAFVGTIFIAFGWALMQREDSFDPTSVQLPNVQWEKICGLLTDMTGDSIAAVNYGLSWMNQGPSAR